MQAHNPSHLPLVASNRQICFPIFGLGTNPCCRMSTLTEWGGRIIQHLEARTRLIDEFAMGHAIDWACRVSSPSSNAPLCRPASAAASMGLDLWARFGAVSNGSLAGRRYEVCDGVPRSLSILASLRILLVDDEANVRTTIVHSSMR